MKNLLKLAAAAAVSAVAFNASAQLTFMDTAAGPGAYMAPVFTTPDPALAYEATDSIANIRLAPMGAMDYLAISTGGSAMVDLGGASSFSFLWGSPDLYNSISVLTSTGTETFTGTDFASTFGLAANGSNANTRWVTLTGAAGQTLESITFASAGMAFELAVATPVPEPENYALLLAGLMAVVYVGGRTNKQRDS